MTYYENENVLYIYIDNNDSKEELWKRWRVVYDDLTPIPLMFVAEPGNTKEYVVFGKICNADRNRISFNKTKGIVDLPQLPNLIYSLTKIQEKADNIRI